MRDINDDSDEPASTSKPGTPAMAETDLKRSSVSMSPPWVGDKSCIRNNWAMQNASSSYDDERLIEFVKRRSEVHERYISETEKTRRLSLGLAALAFIAALLVLAFVPKDDSILSYGIAVTLLVTAAGAAGYKRVWAKTSKIEVSVDENSQSKD